MVIIDVAIELFHEYKYYLGWTFLFNFVLNLVVALGLRVYQLERKLKGQASCCVGDQRPASKEAAEENVACEAVNEDWVTARLERSTSDPNFNALVTKGTDSQSEPNQKQESEVEEWRRGIERIVQIKRLVDAKAEELVEDMSYAPDREFRSFFEDLVKLVKPGAVKKVNKKSETDDEAVAEPKAVEKKQETPKTVKSTFKKSAIPTPERQAPYMNELKNKIEKRYDPLSSDKSIKVD